MTKRGNKSKQGQKWYNNGNPMEEIAGIIGILLLILVIYSMMSGG